MSKPPTEKHSYVGSKVVGKCDKCGQLITELATFEEECFSINRGGIEWLRNYVRERLEKAGVIPEDVLFDVTEKIVHRSLRAGVSKMPDWIDAEGKEHKGEFACVHQADFEIEWAIRMWKEHPPRPITRRRFSLKAFTEMQRSP